MGWSMRYTPTEIVDEHPTDHELRVHLYASLPSTGLRSPELLFDGPVEQSPQPMDDVRVFRALGLHLLVAEGVEAVYRGLQRLNALPRNDPFWHNTNCRPTLGKLSSFLRSVVQENPSNHEARWALCVLSSTARPRPENWAVIFRSGWCELLSIYRLALLYELYGEETGEDFGRFVREVGAENDARPMLEEARRYSFLVDWAVQARDAMSL